jgi:hypothetical protein
MNNKEKIKKINEDKSQLNENEMSSILNAIYAVFTLAIPTYLALYALKKVITFTYRKVANAFGKAYITSDRANKAIDNLWKDSGVVREFSKIIADEGGLEFMAKKLRTDFWNKEIEYEDIAWKGFGSASSKEAVNVVERLISSSAFKSFAIKWELDKFDIKSISQWLYFAITSKDFEKVAQDNIINGVYNNIKKLPKQTKDSDLGTKLKNLLPNWIKNKI